MSSPKFHSLLPIFCVFFLIVGCSDPAGDAEKRFDMVRAAGEFDGMCREAQAVAAAHFEQRDQDGYVRWNKTADSACKLRASEVDFNHWQEEYNINLNLYNNGYSHLKPMLGELEKKVMAAENDFKTLQKDFESELSKDQ